MGSSGCRYGDAFGKPPQVTVSTGRWKIQGKIKSERIDSGGLIFVKWNIQKGKNGEQMKERERKCP